MSDTYELDPDFIEPAPLKPRSVKPTSPAPPQDVVTNSDWFNKNKTMIVVGVSVLVVLIICFECSGFIGSTSSGGFGGAVNKSSGEVFNRIYNSLGLEIHP